MVNQITRNRATSWGLGIAFLFLAAAFGLISAIFPSGFTARLAIVIFATVSLFFAWAFRSLRNRIPTATVFLVWSLLSQFLSCGLDTYTFI
jgi:hypothetical protein